MEVAQLTCDSRVPRVCHSATDEVLGRFCQGTLLHQPPDDLHDPAGQIAFTRRFLSTRLHRRLSRARE